MFVNSNVKMHISVYHDARRRIMMYGNALQCKLTHVEAEYDTCRFSIQSVKMHIDMHFDAFSAFF